MGRVGGQRDQTLLNRIGFAGQQCLFDKEIAGFQHQTVGGNHVARCKHYQIAGNHFDQPHIHRLAITGLLARTETEWRKLSAA